MSNIITFISSRTERKSAMEGMTGMQGISVAKQADKVRPVQKFLFSATMSLKMTGKKLTAHKVSGVENRQ